MDEELPVIVISSDDEADDIVIIIDSDEEDVAITKSNEPVQGLSVLEKAKEESELFCCSHEGKFDPKDSLVNNMKPEGINSVPFALVDISISCYSSIAACARQVGGEAQPTCVYFDTLANTMLQDYHLEGFALQNMLRKGVTPTIFLSVNLMRVLLKYLLGFIKEEVFPRTRNLHVGFNILMKMLKYHPPCKPQMLQYYTKVSQEFWTPLIDRIEEVSLNPEVKKHVAEEEVFENLDIPVSSADPFEDCMSILARQRRYELQSRFRKLSRSEKLEKLFFVFKFFIQLFEKNILVWRLKCSIPNFTPFRRNCTNIVVHLLWGSNIRDDGHTNCQCRRLIKLLTAPNMGAELKRYMVRVISVIATVISVKDSRHPTSLDVGQLSLQFAREISFQLRGCSCLLQILDFLEPPWLKFHVSCCLLNIEEPAKLGELFQRLLKQGSTSMGYGEDSQDVLYRLIASAVFAIALVYPCKTSVQKPTNEYQIALDQIYLLLPELPMKFSSLFAFLSCRG